MAKTTAEKIKNIEAKMQQLENQRKQLIQKQKEQERKDRTRRLCKRMELFESMLPDTITLTDDLFKSFLEKTITTEHSRRILDVLTAQNTTTAAPQTTGTAARDNPTPAAKPTQTAQESGVGEDTDEGNGETGNRVA